MKHRHFLTVVAAVAVALSVVGVVAAATGQSLADLARQEELRRKAIKRPGKVYTNQSVRPAPGEVIPTPSGPPVPPPDQPGAAAGQPPQPAPPKPSQPEPPTDPRRTPEYWRQRMVDARQQRDSNAVALDALQSHINALWADFTARDDPAQRAVIGATRQRSLDELERRRAQQVLLEQAILDIEEEARRANVPPGWLR
jgi:hypothetical protein